MMISNPEKSNAHGYQEMKSTKGGYIGTQGYYVSLVPKAQESPQ